MVVLLFSVLSEGYTNISNKKQEIIDYHDHTKELIESGYDAGKLLNTAFLKQDIEMVLYLLAQDIDKDTLSKALAWTVNQRWIVPNNKTAKEEFLIKLKDDFSDFNFFDHLNPFHTRQSNADRNLKKILTYDSFGIKHKENKSRNLAFNKGLIDLLIKKGADINYIDRHGKMSIHKAAKEGDFDAIENFLEYGSNINALDSDGNNLVHLATLGEEIGLLKKLSEFNIDFNAKNKEGIAPIFLAVNRNLKNDILDILIENGADINILNNEGQSLLHVASEYESDKYKKNRIVKYLLDKGLSVNSVDKKGNTPVHYAANWKKYNDSLERDLKPDVLPVLLKYNPDLTIKNNDGKTPLDIARDGNQLEIIGLLFNDD